MLLVTPDVGVALHLLGCVWFQEGTVGCCFFSFFVSGLQLWSHSPNTVSARLWRGAAEQRRSQARRISLPERDEGAELSRLRVKCKSPERQQSVCKYHRWLGASCSAKRNRRRSSCGCRPHSSAFQHLPVTLPCRMFSFRSHVVAFTQPTPCKAISGPESPAFMSFCQCSASGLTSDLPLSPQVIQKTQRDGICRLTCHHQAQFCSSTAAVEMQKLWCSGRKKKKKQDKNTIIFHAGFCGKATVYQPQVLVLSVLPLLAAEFKISELVPDPPKTATKQIVRPAKETRQAFNTQTTPVTLYANPNYCGAISV